MQNLNKTQNTIILVALENFLADCQGRDNLIKQNIQELIDIYQKIT